MGGGVVGGRQPVPGVRKETGGGDERPQRTPILPELPGMRVLAWLATPGVDRGKGRAGPRGGLDRPKPRPGARLRQSRHTEARQYGT